MKEVFEAMLHDSAVMSKMKSSPVKEAVFFALYDFVKQGNELTDVPWFAVTKFARRRKTDTLITSKAA
ncbi:hypothetical protein ACQRCJ_12085 [Desulfovibrio sp. SGI.102]|uniref:hypothetical protein n=1 Tax=Desulfovibrio sp. SGI.102 TaxID=3420559 RepID=UPI003D070CB8